MITEHDWSQGDRCPHCGTLKGFHETKAQNCVPRWSEGETPRPVRTGQSSGDYVADDAVTISARLKELEACATARLRRAGCCSCQGLSSRRQAIRSNRQQS
jgi:hypothetical protein